MQALNGRTTYNAVSVCLMFLEKDGVREHEIEDAYRSTSRSASLIDVATWAESNRLAASRLLQSSRQLPFATAAASIFHAQPPNQHLQHRAIAHQHTNFSCNQHSSACVKLSSQCLAHVLLPSLHLPQTPQNRKHASRMQSCHHDGQSNSYIGTISSLAMG